MYVRVFDKTNNRYYKSMVYCKVSDEKFRYSFIVLNPHEGRFELVDRIEMLDIRKNEYLHLIEYIQYDTDDWVEYKNSRLLKYKQYCKAHNKEPRIDFLWGYRDVCENFEFLCEILEKRYVSIGEFDINIRELSDVGEWQYILTQKDADDFMKLFAGFHDSTLNRLVFEEASYNRTSAIATFDNSVWYGVVEICFEKIVAINIRPIEDDYSNDIYSATLMIQDESVFWADCYMENEDLSYDGTYIKALSIKWRKIK